MGRKRANLCRMRMNMQARGLQVTGCFQRIMKNMYPYTITVLKPRCTKDFSHGICLCNIYHIIYQYTLSYTLWYIYGISMVHPQLTYTMPQTLCTSAFRRGDGIWVYVFCLKLKDTRNGFLFRVTLINDLRE